MTKPVISKTIILMSIVLAVILVPFFLFHDFIDAWTEGILKASGQHPVYIAILLCLLLASDILLPVPSSIVSIGCGFLLGFVNGAIVSFTGMVLGCLIGYALGKGSSAKIKWLDAGTRQSMEAFFNRYGKWSIIIARPIPVLAEASVFFAGISSMSFKSFMFISSLSNLGISLMYAAIGAYAFTVNSILLAFAGAMVLPGIALLINRIFLKPALKTQ